MANRHSPLWSAIEITGEGWGGLLEAAAVFAPAEHVNQVYLRGLLTTPTFVGETVIGTLPAELRPSKATYFNGVEVPQSGSLNTWRIDPNGNIVSMSLGSRHTISLDTVSFLSA